ncbi:MAG: 1-acyl-sn-glycerol-3-phosphate acyltransferase [Bacteroidales bacterium]|nr:1-acyl-sn-glycerol-3-phosphate acyltransferase [Bacteroidales bacterium]
MSGGFSRFMLKALGWKTDGDMAPEGRNLYLFAPHTSIWDFAIGFFYFRSQGHKLKVMIKKEAFFFPLGPLLKAMGGFPIDRSNPKATLVSVIHAMEEDGKRPFQLVICPEGTRKAVKKWKTGYHTIARATGAKVYLAFADYRTKRIGVIPGGIELTDDARSDTDRIQKIYASMNLTGLHKKGYSAE